MGFVKLSFLPAFFPVVLLPFYWIFFLLFYIFYLPVYFVLWIFSPYRSRKSRTKVFEGKTSDVKRDLSSKPLKKEDSKDA
jgi:hypothetical protein